MYQLLLHCRAAISRFGGHTIGHRFSPFSISLSLWSRKNNANGNGELTTHDNNFNVEFGPDPRTQDGGRTPRSIEMTVVPMKFTVCTTGIPTENTLGFSRAGLSEGTTRRSICLVRERRTHTLTWLKRVKFGLHEFVNDIYISHARMDIAFRIRERDHSVRTHSCLLSSYFSISLLFKFFSLLCDQQKHSKKKNEQQCFCLLFRLLAADRMVYPGLHCVRSIRAAIAAADINGLQQTRPGSEHKHVISISMRVTEFIWLNAKRTHK